MKNRYLDPKTEAEIDGQVSKILRGLGNPDPPLDLNQVRELLELDRQYYSSTEDGLLREMVSRARVAGKLVSGNPFRIIDLVRKFDLKALYVPDGRRIFIDESQPKPKWRWNEAHESIHSVVPEHAKLMQGDDLYSLSPACHMHIESEANYGAGRLLFLQTTFEQFVRDSQVGFGLVQAGSKYFGNTMTSTLWRLVEHLHIPAVGVVSQHPRYPDDAFDANKPCRYFLRSRLFEERFSEITEVDVFQMILGYCSYTKRGPLGTDELIILDDSGEEHVFQAETFFNGHDALTLITHLKVHTTAVAVAA